jgi:hypothetical protein
MTMWIYINIYIMNCYKYEIIKNNNSVSILEDTYNPGFYNFQKTLQKFYEIYKKDSRIYIYIYKSSDYEFQRVKNKYRCKVLDDDLIFYHGNTDKFIIGGLLSFVVELNCLPTKKICVEYEEFKEYLKNTTSDKQTQISVNKINNQISNQTLNETGNTPLIINKLEGHQKELINETKDPVQLQNELIELNQTREKIKKDIKANESILQKNMDNLQDEYCELRDMENNKKREEEKKKENIRIFNSDKRTYEKIKNKINNSDIRFDKTFIPDLFVAKYNILEYMENECLLCLETTSDNKEDDNKEDDNKEDSDIEDGDIEYMIYELLMNIISEINFSIADIKNNNISDMNNQDVIKVLKETILEKKNDYISVLFNKSIDEELNNDLFEIMFNFMDYISKSYKDNIINTEKDIMNNLNSGSTNSIFKETN